MRIFERLNRGIVQFLPIKYENISNAFPEAPIEVFRKRIDSIQFAHPVNFIIGDTLFVNINDNFDFLDVDAISDDHFDFQGTIHRFDSIFIYEYLWRDNNIIEKFESIDKKCIFNIYKGLFHEDAFPIHIRLYESRCRETFYNKDEITRSIFEQRNPEVGKENKEDKDDKDEIL